MTPRNPYAPSTASLNSRREPVTGAAASEVWRDGKYLVVDVDAALPHRCVKCNAPAHDPTKLRTFYWHHPGVYAVILINIIVYAIVAAIVRKKIALAPGLCEAHKRSRRNKILLAWGGVLAAFVVPILLATVFSDGAWIIAVGVLIFLVALLFGIIAPRVMYARKIDLNVARFGGCGEEFLDSLPQYLD
jgi:hypothetical protein